MRDLRLSSGEGDRRRERDLLLDGSGEGERRPALEERTGDRDRRLGDRERRLGGGERDRRPGCGLQVRAKQVEISGDLAAETQAAAMCTRVLPGIVKTL